MTTTAVEASSVEAQVQVFLKDGTEVKANDHVYVSPSWSIRDGTPYSIARIMEFLGPEGSSLSSTAPAPYTRVRLAWYYRPRDVLDRPPLNDSRLLLASIYSEIVPISQIRSRCWVVHRDRITDLSGWKKRGDRFYFSRLFDPYIKKEFEVLRVGDVRNVPENVRAILHERYEYVAAEKEVVPDLTDTIRVCATPSCGEWCPSIESVQCDRCKRYFHMRCVQPPLQAKPSRGYGWTCAPCSRRHEEEVDEMRGGNGGAPAPNHADNNAFSSGAGPSSSSTHATSGLVTNGANANGSSKPPPSTATSTFPPSFKSNAPAPRGRGRPRKDKSQAEKEESLPVRYYRMWPFRYFGQYTLVEDALDPEDLIYPRAATRVGPKYQTLLPEEGGAHWGIDEERGSDKTVEVLAAVNDFTPSEIAEMRTCLRSLINAVSTSSDKTPSTNHKSIDVLTEIIDPRFSIDFLTEAIRQFSEATLNGRSLSSVTTKTMSMAGTLNWKPLHSTSSRRIGSGPGYTDKPWSHEEIVAFEDAIMIHGAELRAVRDEVVVRSIYEVVRFYGRWKNFKLGEENARIREQKQKHEPVRKPTPTSTRASSLAPTANVDTDGHRSTPGPSGEGLVAPSLQVDHGFSRTQIIGADDESDSESSIVVPPSKTPFCGACRTRESKGNVWWKAPKGLASGVLCDGCGVGYRKYADLNMRERREESVGVTGTGSTTGTGTTSANNSRTRGREGRESRESMGEKREGTPLAGNVSKRSKTSSVQSTPPPPPPPSHPNANAVSNLPQIRCCACSKNGPIGKVVRCKSCGFSVHATSCGTVLEADKVDDWRCDLCENEETQEASVYHDCLLCPRPPLRGPSDGGPSHPSSYLRGHSQSHGSFGPPPSSYLRACKATESQGWAHVLCSTFIPEVNFTDTTTLKCVEGISTIPMKRWLSRCTICQQQGGAVIRCHDCPKEFHVSCAWAYGHTFGFEIQPVKGTRRDNHITTIFKGEPGCMNAVISCKEHNHSRRQIYEICETDDGGESALQVYCRAYKQVPQVSQTHALLRKARRLDQLIANAVVVAVPTRDSLSLGPGPDPAFDVDTECVKCTTQFTPRFHSTPGGWVCHACNFIQQPPPNMMGMEMEIDDVEESTIQTELLPALLHEVAVN